MPTSAPHGYRSAQQFLRGEGASLLPTAEMRLSA
jgi:hypothetical protein